MTTTARWILLLLLLWAGSSPALASPQRTLILGIRGGGRVSDKAREAIRARLGHMGEEALTPPLSDAELSCRATSCLTGLADRHGAGRVIGGEVLGTAPNYVVKLWLLALATQDLRESQGACEDCAPDDLVAALAATAGGLIERTEHPDPAPSTPAPPPASSGTRAAGALVVQPAGRPTLASLPTWRQALAGTFGGIAVVTLATAIGLTARNGAPSGDCEKGGLIYDLCHNNFTTGAAVSYTAFGLSAAGLVLTLTLPRGKR